MINGISRLMYYIATWFEFMYSLDIVITSLTNDLSHVDRWRQLDHMSINSDKSNVMFISSRQNRQFLLSNPEIPYHDSVIKACSTAKLPGVTVNNSLSWNDHIETVFKKSKTNLYIFSRIKLYLSTENLNDFITDIFPHFDFCCVIWGNCTHYMEEKTVRLQKMAARVILDWDFYTPSSTMFSDLKWMSFPERVIYRKAIQTLKTIRRDGYEYL